MWAWKLRKMNGPGFTWPLFMFAGALPEAMMAKMGRIYLGRPLRIKTRKELLETVKPHLHQFLRPDTGDMPEMPDTPISDQREAAARWPHSLYHVDHVDHVVNASSGVRSHLLRSRPNTSFGPAVGRSAR